MLELEQALRIILDGIQPLPCEIISISQAVQRILAQPIVAPSSLPAFDNSAMDGFAIRAVDSADASPMHPVSLRRAGLIAAGTPSQDAAEPQSCIRVFTGAPLPPGADAVVMQEDTTPDPQRSDGIQIREPVKPWENVRFKGEDIKQGEQVLSAGETVTPEKAGLLSALGLSHVTVHRRPIIALLATGSELVEPGAPLPPGKIYESNRLTLATLLPSLGAVPMVYPIIPDDQHSTQTALQKALSECDGVISTGGVSVGEKDYVKSSFEAIGGRLDFWKVAIKPGKPFVFGTWQNKSFFGLPGNPVSAFVTFLLLVRPAILRLQAAADLGMRSVPGLLGEPLANHGDRRHFMRVRMDREGKVTLAGTQASHILHSLARANGLVDVPPQTVLPAGSLVRVLSWSY
ncbi:MAG: Molybdenum cofactor synthesis domain protein [Verrucomicrobiales bacterium]|nr:Molybdenum cofactor synthesis domain protein [Verrucomicrobiales bacterium]